MQQVDTLPESYGYEPHESGEGRSHKYGQKYIGRACGSRLSLICNDGNGYKGKPCGIEHEEHYHGIRSRVFLRVELLELFDGFKPEGCGGVVESEHIGRKIHKHRAKHRMPLRYLGKYLTEKRRGDTSQKLYDTAPLPYLHKAQPERQHARKPQRDFEACLGVGKHRLHNGVEAAAIARKESYRQRHNDGYEYESYPNIIQYHCLLRLYL